MAKTKYLKLKPAKSNPLQKRVLMGFLAIFFVITMILTIPAAVAKIGPLLGVDPGRLLFWGKSLSSISGGMIMIVVAGALAASPIIAGALVIGGLLAIGWGVYSIAKDQGVDVGSMGNK